MNALIYVQRSGMPLIRLAPGKPNQATSAKRCKSSQAPGLTFVSFSYKRNGFASFATKRRKIAYLTWIIHKNPQ